MEKTYRFTLPQNKKVESTNVRVENGEVFVDVEFKEKFEPKECDFLVDKDGCVFICSRPFSDFYGCYAGSCCDGTIHAESEVTWVKKAGCRYATPEEKAAFLKRLEKECHKRWNPETKQLEDIRWKPQDGETYFYVNHYGVIIAATYSGFPDDILRCSVENCFKTNEAAQKVSDQIKEILRNSKAE